MAAPVAIDPVIQKTEGDCVIASLSMLLGIGYPEVSHKARELWPNPHRTGLTVRDAQRLIRSLTGRVFESVKAVDNELDDQTGVLFVSLPDDYHAVALFEGVIFNPADGMIWNRSAYFATKKAHPVRLLRP